MNTCAWCHAELKTADTDCQQCADRINARIEAMRNKKGGRFEREMLFMDCLEACRTDIPRTDEEAARVEEKAKTACKKLGLDYPEDAKDL